MVVRVLLALSSLHVAIVPVVSDGECPDIHGRSITPGSHYVPGPDTCTLCICENGQPKWCKAVLCSPPQDCKSFRLGNTCCEFICLDDALSKHPDSILDGSPDFGLRLIATAVVIILLLAMIFFTVHRLRQRKLRGHQNRQMNEDQRSLASIGYIGGSLGYLGGVCEEAPSHYSNIWKPQGNYFPRGEAPPPYDEAVAQARAEAISINMSGFHRSFPLSAATNMESLIRMENNTGQTRNNGSTGNNIHDNGVHHPQYYVGSRPFYLNNVANNCNNNQNNPGDRQLIVMGTNPPRNFTAQHSITSATGNNNFISTLKITSSLTGLPSSHGRTSNPAEYYPSQHPRNNATQPSIQSRSSFETTRQHRTIPRMVTALENVQAGESSSFPQLKQRTPHSKSNRDISSYRTNNDSISHSNSSNSNINNNTSSSNRLMYAGESNSSSNSKKVTVSNEETKLLLDSNHRLTKENVLRFGTELIHHPMREEIKSTEIGSDVCPTRSDAAGKLLERHPLLSMTTDTAPCKCNYDAPPLPPPAPPSQEDPDDYHSECENCKSATGSRYYLDESDEEGGDMVETMTLHRRTVGGGGEHEGGDPTSLTLPVKTKRTNRNQGGSRDAWFSSRPGTSSSEDD